MPQCRNRLPARTQVGRFFKIKERKTCFSTELRAGTVTFLTVRRASWQSGLLSAGCVQALVTNCLAATCAL
jgi:xanthine/uracil/vitamin C permease (AzgA family)